MTDLEQLDKLIGDVKAGKAFRHDAPQRKNRTAEYECLGGYYQDCMAYGAFHGSLDAAMALHEALLPGWTVAMHAFSSHGKAAAFVRVFYMRLHEDDPVRAANSSGYKGVDPARALLLADLLAYRETQKDKTNE